MKTALFTKESGEIICKNHDGGYISICEENKNAIRRIFSLLRKYPMKENFTGELELEIVKAKDNEFDYSVILPVLNIHKKYEYLLTSRKEVLKRIRFYFEINNYRSREFTRSIMSNVCIDTSIENAKIYTYIENGKKKTLCWLIPWRYGKTFYQFPEDGYKIEYKEQCNFFNEPYYYLVDLMKNVTKHEMERYNPKVRKELVAVKDLNPFQACYDSNKPQGSEFKITTLKNYKLLVSDFAQALYEGNVNEEQINKLNMDLKKFFEKVPIQIEKEEQEEYIDFALANVNIEYLMRIPINLKVREF